MVPAPVARQMDRHRLFRLMAPDLVRWGITRRGHGRTESVAGSWNCVNTVGRQAGWQQAGQLAGRWTAAGRTVGGRGAMTTMNATPLTRADRTAELSVRHVGKPRWVPSYPLCRNPRECLEAAEGPTSQGNAPPGDQLTSSGFFGMRGGTLKQRGCCSSHPVAERSCSTTPLGPGPGWRCICTYTGWSQTPPLPAGRCFSA